MNVDYEPIQAGKNAGTRRFGWTFLGMYLVNLGIMTAHYLAPEARNALFVAYVLISLPAIPCLLPCLFTTQPLLAATESELLPYLLPALGALGSSVLWAWIIKGLSRRRILD